MKADVTRNPDDSISIVYEHGGELIIDAPPHPRKHGGRAFPQAGGELGAQAGMSLRQWYAGQSLTLAGATSLAASVTSSAPVRVEDVVREAFLIADAMLAAEDK